jgi:opacity protein-like surface antigen
MRFVRIATFVSAILLASSASANDAIQEPTRRTVLVPALGVVTGRFFDVPVQRVSLGFDIGSHWPSSVTLLLGARLEPGRTENGLGAHRLELGATAMVGRWLRAGTGVHVAYAMIVRTTESGALAQALIGNIGGFGIGTHAQAGLEIPLSATRSLSLLGRGSVEGYVGSIAWQIGPVISMRF